MIRRLRTLTLLTGTLLSGVIATAFVVSAWWWVVIHVPSNRGPALYLIAGSASVVADEMLSIPALIERSSLGLSRWNDWDGEFWLYLTLPLYAVFAAVAVPTLLIWRFWPKTLKPGCCRCGYDLTGNTSGVCPECGRGCVTLRTFRRRPRLLLGLPCPLTVTRAQATRVNPRKTPILLAGRAEDATITKDSEGG